ncbi:chromosome partitioning protein (plasmid) [Microvirga ossetica]|uniref:Chromosome partitioning protein n=1 Tax=Microvirga ossetica TaxID=1882682 RepID=A0A1B2EQN1_9HYPH|nr:CpsD/CapB family tyrosine-protein kinase [Microvirga ossetica]ANY82259.1 chromosome partitioning protein [Microvirga ossetica]
MEQIHDVLLNSENETSVTFAESRASSFPPDENLTWMRLRQMKVDESRAADERIVTITRTNPAHFPFDILRTKMLRIMRENKWTSVAITSPTVGCGKTVVGLNLAFSFASLLDCRTVLVDLDLRQPKVADVLGMGQLSSIEDFLVRDAPIECVFARFGENLAIGANRGYIAHAAELLHGPGIRRRMTEMKEQLRPDLILFDLPPMLATDDVLAFLPNVDCAILVAAAEVSTISEIDVCEHTLREETNLLGVVLNKCRFDPRKYGY